MSIDIGFTHIALTATDLDASIKFYSYYAHMKVVHERIVAKYSKTLSLNKPQNY